ncbi:hypothetical protein LTR10_023078 [Elasticomyces elasticus]|uniref:Chitin synthase regulatory factor 3 n=1 Tax=Exophiala sideris TaxID=1016849 RepID=A0ABR0JM20_9EURO|nr:hypothetical protein LTR10_023078 [Elasticomyces elasticus]KAK5036353.1 hypothetical protein LTS07_002080 [Exophiala sideris]KAK5041815.1 hypothetical protein LTR13_002482 [Exophiala sideris]KAK5066737.1 hypothetical protein LTR69_002084 [Exophiala sideris]KAK5184795.1 hypothetical protein LTR44_002641 [Eurotiomycetes sp. CCFEE 6388]
MTSNQYRQQWQEGPTQVQQQYNYDRRHDQMQWQENERSQGAYTQEYQRYNEAPKGRNGYGPGPAPAPAPMSYDQQGQWQTQSQQPQGGYQDQYNGNGNGYSDEPYYEQPPPSNRTYHYDERYRTNGQGRPAPEQYPSSHSDGQKPPRNQRSGPPNAQKRSKPRERERILAQPTSPKSLAWDNPFGAFPSKNKKHGETQRHASLDGELNNLNLLDRPKSDEPRPHTSHGHRRKEPPAPLPLSTSSHGQRPGMGIAQDSFQITPPYMVRPPRQDSQVPPGRGPQNPQTTPPDNPRPFPRQDHEALPGRGQRDLQMAPADMGHPPPRQDSQQPPGRVPTDTYRQPPSRPQDTVPDSPRQEVHMANGRGQQDPQKTPPDMARPPPQRDHQPPAARVPVNDYRSPPSMPQDSMPSSPRHPPRQDPRRPPPVNQNRSGPGSYGNMDGYGAQGLYDGGRNFPSHDSVPNSPRRPPRQDPRVSPPMNQDRGEPTPYGGLNDYGGYDARVPYDGSGNYPPQANRRNEYAAREPGYSQDHNPPSRAPVPPNEFRQRQAPRPPVVEARPPVVEARPPALEHYDGSSYRAVPSAVHGKTRSNELPNFDAIPTRANEKAEFDQQVYQKPTYQVPGAFPGAINTTQNGQAPANDLKSPLAEFAFDIGPTPNNRPSDRRSPPNQQNHPQRGYDQRAGPMGAYGEMPRQQPQYPPRSASRNGMKPPMGNTPPLPNDSQGSRSFSEGQYPRNDQYPARPHTANAPRPPPQNYDMGNPYGQHFSPEFMRSDSAPVGAGPPMPGYSQSPVQQFRQPYGQGPALRKPSQDNYGGGVLPVRGISQDNYNPGVAPVRGISQDNYNPGVPRPGTSSAHPVPVRHYGNTNAPENPATVNPDALPAHPEPVRARGSNGYPRQPPAPQPVQRKEIAAVVNGAASPQLTSQELNNLRDQYSNKPTDQALGLTLAKKLVEAARVLSDEGGKADAKQTQKNRERYIFEAHKLVKKLVAANYPEAMFYLADCHGQGLLGLPVDPKEAFHLYQSAAKLGHAPSAYRVAVCCELGSEEGGGTKRDPLKAMQWYKRAATLGDAPAMYKMGMILLKGLLGQQKNPREAVSWLKRASERADKDNPHALHELGLLYESAASTDHIVKDEQYALSLFQQASDLGYKYSQFRLGSAFEYGLLGCPIDARQSIAWYSKAAAQGEHQSELALSGWYLTGSEPLLQQSDTEAFLWARKAASSGLAKAEYAMGYFYEVGIGTAVDVEEAKRWYYRAASQYFPKARERLEELKKGQKMQKTRVSRSNVNRQSDGECSVM